MSCCGQRRAILHAPMPVREAPIPPVPPEPARAAPVAAGERRVAVEYLARAPVAVRGAATGRLYRFGAAEPRQHVEERDAAALLRTRFFRRAD